MAHRGREARPVHEGVQLRDDRERNRLGAASAERKANGRVQSPVQPTGIGAQIREQPRPAHRRSEQPQVGDGACREHAQLGEVRGQVMAHHDGCRETVEIECAGERLGPCEQHAFGARKVTRDCVGGAVIDQGHFPAEPHRKIHDR